jgi:hypothetical protein
VHVPETALEFRAQLAWPPQHHPGVEARVVGLGLDDAVDHVAVEHEVQVGRQLHGAVAGAVAALDECEDDFGADRAAQVDRVRHFERRPVPRKEPAQGHGRRLVDDQADMLAIAEGLADEDGRAIEPVP